MKTQNKEKEKKEILLFKFLIEFHMNLRAHCVWWNLSLTLADPYLQIMGGGGGGGGAAVIQTLR